MRKCILLRRREAKEKVFMPPNNVLWNIIRGSEGEDRLVQKLRRINKEKDFGEGPRKRKNPENQLETKPDLLAVPPVWACVRLSQLE